MSNDQVQALALRAQYSVFGRAAVYTPPGGGTAIACTVITDNRDRDYSLREFDVVYQGDQARVRKSELADPLEGGTLTVTFGDLDITYQINAFTSPDRNRLQYMLDLEPVE